MSTAPAPSTGFTQAMGVAGPVLSLVGMANSAIGAYYGAKSQQLTLQSQALSYQFQSQMSGINARMIEAQAEQIWRAGRQQEMQAGLKAGAVKSATRASLAARGIQAGVGTAAELIATTDLMKEIDLITINSNTVRAVEAERMRKVGVEATGAMQAVSAQNLLTSAGTISPFASMSTSLLGGASSFANSWYQNRNLAASTARMS
jgi:aspartate/glutamate racemase